MLYVFWWTGKGYRVPLIVFGACMVAGFIFQATAPRLLDQLWFWGCVLLAAAIPVWLHGQRLNATRRAAIRSTRPRDRLLYQARHKFLSLPFETSAILVAVGGLVLLTAGAAKLL